MLKLHNRDDLASLEADATTMQLLLGAAIEGLLAKPNSSAAHKKLYNELASAVRNVSPWPLSNAVVEPEELSRRLKNDGTNVADELDDLLS